MDLKGERLIPASRDRVWAALNDPAVLKHAIPGCESLERTADNTMAATATIKVGPVAARFSGTVVLSELDPPNGCRIEGEGQGGAAGFAKGGALVRLEAQGGDTLLRYEVQAQVGGKLSQLGGRLIEATAKQMADAFFTRFAEQLAPPAALQAAAAAAPMAASAPRGPTSLALPAAVVIGCALIAWALASRASQPDAILSVAVAALVALAGAVGWLAGQR